MKNITVVGGGVMGLGCAWRLAQDGHQVTLLEKGQCGEGATTASLGALMPYNGGRVDEIPAFQHKSLWMYPRLAAELMQETGLDIQYNRIGRLQPIMSEHQLKQTQFHIEEANKRWPNPGAGDVQQILSASEVAELDSEIEIGELGALYCKATGVVSVHHLVAALRAACLKLGVDIRENCEVDPFNIQNGRVQALRTGHGPMNVDYVVLASGAWSAKLAGEEKIPVEPLKGQAILVQNDALELNHLVRARGLYIIPQAGHRFLVGATKEHGAGFDLSVDDDGLDTLIEKASSVIPALAEGKVVKHWAGLRPHSTSKEPTVGFVDGVENLVAVTGHGGIGICMAPATMSLVADLLR